jgi:hypothetical protein
MLKCENLKLFVDISTKHLLLDRWRIKHPSCIYIICIHTYLHVFACIDMYVCGFCNVTVCIGCMLMYLYVLVCVYMYVCAYIYIYILCLYEFKCVCGGEV